MREFVVDESGGQQLLAFAAGDEESEAGRKRFADVAVVAEADRDGGTVLDGGEFGGEFGTRDAKHVRRLRERAERR